MPRPFSEEERGRALEALLGAARAEFTARGYRKANVGAIAGAAGIGKGTVYLFFPSKAELFAAVLERSEEETREALDRELAGRFERPRERVEHFLRAMLERMSADPLLRIVVDPGEAAAFFRELPAEGVERLQADDDAYFERLVRKGKAEGWLVELEPALIGALGRALFAVALHRDLVGEERYPRVVNLLVSALSAELAPS